MKAWGLKTPIFWFFTCVIFSLHSLKLMLKFKVWYHFEGNHLWIKSGPVANHSNKKWGARGWKPPYWGFTPVSCTSFIHSHRCKSLKFGINLKVMSCGSILVREETFVIRKWGVGAGTPYIFESAPMYFFNHSNSCKSFIIGISLKAIICMHFTFHPRRK